MHCTPTEKVFSVDSVEWGIILDLLRNCRMSLRSLADRHEITPNAIRKRITNMENRGVIERYVVELSRAMMDSEVMFALLYTDKSIDDDTFADMVFAHPLVNRVHYDSFGSCVVNAEYSGSKQMSELSSFFRGLESVREVEVHTLPVPRGEKKTLTNLQLRVLAPLLYDPRMRIVDIANASGLTVRRVKRTLSDLIESRSVNFTIVFNATALDASLVAYRVTWDSKETSPQEIDEILREKFPNQYWRLNYSATEPLLWCDFLIESNSASEEIVQEMRKIPSVDIRNTILVYPAKKRRLVRNLALRKLIEDAGYV
jgi:DNA-binding Lrp family transcriptional regulator